MKLFSTWSGNFVISSAAVNQATTFEIADIKLYASVVNLSTQYNAKLLQQLKSGFKCTVDLNKYQQKTATQISPNQYLDHLIDPSLQGVNRRFALAFNGSGNRIGHSA